MYFSVEPKIFKKDLYDREKELESLEHFAKNGRIASIYGLRRVGKTSLLKVFLE